MKVFNIVNAQQKQMGIYDTNSNIVFFYLLSSYLEHLYIPMFKSPFKIKFVNTSKYVYTQ